MNFTVPPLSELGRTARLEIAMPATSGDRSRPVELEPFGSGPLRTRHFSIQDPTALWPPAPSPSAPQRPLDRVQTLDWVARQGLAFAQANGLPPEATVASAVHNVMEYEGRTAESPRQVATATALWFANAEQFSMELAAQTGESRPPPPSPAAV